MNHSGKIAVLFFTLVLTCAFFAGCTNSSSSSGTETPVPATTATPAGPVYSAGDIVKSASGTATTGWLVISFDPTTDQYTRALIYQNADGTWGYRMNDKTETSDRKVMEKVYTIKAGNVAVSSVRIGTVTATPIITATASRTTVTTTAVATATTAAKPQFKDIIPEEANAGKTIAITDLVGANFQSGATVKLAHTGSTDITATDVVWVSSSHMTCKFAIPSDAVTGVWDIIITNPDGQFVRYNNYFTIHGSTSAGASTTTSTTSGTVGITSVDPPRVTIASTTGWQGTLTIYTSTDIQNGATVRLIRSGKVDIVGDTGPISSNRRSIACTFVIPVNSQGSWTVKLTNPDGTYGTKSDAFTIG